MTRKPPTGGVGSNQYQTVGTPTTRPDPARVGRFARTATITGPTVDHLARRGRDQIRSEADLAIIDAWEADTDLAEASSLLVGTRGYDWTERAQACGYELERIAPDQIEAGDLIISHSPGRGSSLLAVTAPLKGTSALATFNGVSFHVGDNPNNALVIPDEVSYHRTSYAIDGEASIHRLRRT